MSLTDAVAAACGGVVKVYWTASGEVHALKGIDAVVPSGAVTAVVGPSGSGKSSLLRILAALDRATAGSVTVAGHELAGMSRAARLRLRRRLVGYVFQQPSQNLFAHLSAIEHLRHAASVRGGRGGRPEELLEAVGLTHRRDHRPDQLSGGEQQRLAFAQAVVGEPRLVVADEPTAELDHSTAANVLAVVGDLAARGVAVIVATHDEHAVAVADQTLHLRHGAVEAESRGGGVLSVIDAAGRVQLPPEALRLFPTRRAVLRVTEGGVALSPPQEDAHD